MNAQAKALVASYEIEADPPGTKRTWSNPGILGSTSVTTKFGEVPAQLLRIGDELRTHKGLYLRILTIKEYKIDDELFDLRPDTHPVCLRAGSLGNGYPCGDVGLSPAQTVLDANDRSIEKAFRADEVSSDRYDLDRTLGYFSYFEIFLVRPDFVCCEGIWVRAATARQKTLTGGRAN